MPTRLKKSLEDHFLFIKGKKYDLIIIDDLLPIPLTPWRNFEYENLIRLYPKSKVIVDFSNTLLKGEKEYYQHFEELQKGYPLLAEKLTPIRKGTSINSKLVYLLFYNNIKRYYTLLKKNKAFFGFTLYPGGGFKLNDTACDTLLKEAIGDPLCKFVITDQKVTYDYLTNILQMPKEKIFFIYGIPLQFKDTKETVLLEKKYFSGNKTSIDVVFIAHKYRPYGKDKGFDVFQEAVLALIDNPSFNFHIVGNFTKADLIYTEIENRVKFYGHIGEEIFSTFFEDKDILISPNKPNVIAPGAFDGFPLGSSLAGGFNNCVMLLTNELNESPEIFIDGLHYLKIRPTNEDIVDKLLVLKGDKERMKLIATEGKKRISEIYNYKNQNAERLTVISKFI